MNDAFGENSALGPWWARQGLNLRPHPCEGCALPLSYAPVPNGAPRRPVRKPDGHSRCGDDCNGVLHVGPPPDAKWAAVEAAAQIGRASCRERVCQYV